MRARVRTARTASAFVRHAAHGARALTTASSAGDADGTPLTGTVVTAQANFLRVVVDGDVVVGAHDEDRKRQLEEAKMRASEAGAREDVERLEAMLAEEDRTTELLCVARALLKKIKKPKETLVPQKFKLLF